MENKSPPSPAGGSAACGSSSTSPVVAGSSAAGPADAAVGPRTAAINPAGRRTPHVFAPNPGAAMFTWHGSTKAPSSGAFASLVTASSAAYAPAVPVAATATPGMRTRPGTAPDANPDADKSRLARFGRALVVPITKHATPKSPAHSAIASVAAVASAVGASSARPLRPLPAPVRPLTAPPRIGEMISVSAIVPGSFMKEEDPEWVKQAKRDAGIEVDGKK